MKTNITIFAAALAVFAIAPPAGAQVAHECAGIGVQGREAAETVPHTLRLVYAEPDGDYLGYVDTRITGPGGELVTVTCPGPWVLVNLPDGSYEVTASIRGETKSRRVTIAGGRQQEQVLTF